MTGAKRSRLFHAFAGVLCLAGILAATPAVAWEPEKPVELVVMGGAGGGADQIARLLQGLIEEKALSPVAFVPINKDGGSGTESLRYLKAREGDDYTLLVTLNAFYTTPILQEDLDVDVGAFTPIGRVALDTFLLWVNAAREDIEDLDTFVVAVKAAETEWTMGGTGSGQEDSVLIAMMEEALGIEVTYVTYPGGVAVAKALAKEQVDSTVNNPAEQADFMRAGDTKALVQFTAERMEAFPDVPTAKELGHDIEYDFERSVFGPPGMSEAAQAWYAELFEALFQSDEWQAFCVEDGLDCSQWLEGDDLAAFHQAQLERHRAFFERAGVDALAGK